MVFTEFNCKTFKGYHDLYLTTDVTLLCDVFENFRQEIWSSFGLECLYYYGIPGIAFDSMLKINLVDRKKKGLPDIENLCDLDMILMCEAGQRGGISHASHRYAFANEDTEGYKTSIQYWDANNLYGWAMCQELPAYDYRWVVDSYIDHLNIYIALGNCNELRILLKDRGYILDVDLEVPSHLHDYFNDYPLAPENMKVDRNDLSEFQRSFNIASDVPKLICNLKSKKNYIILIISCIIWIWV